MSEHVIEINELEPRVTELLERVAAGDTVMITRDGQPAAKIIPYREEQLVRKKREMGSARGMIEMSDDFDEPLEDFKEYM